MNNEVVGLGRFQVKFEASAIRHKQLYANGRMQVRVLVSISGLDEQGNDVSMHAHPALETLRLIAFNGSMPLEKDWRASTRENRYAHEMTGGIARIKPMEPAENNRLSSANDEVQLFEYWVTSTRPGTMQIAAEITLNGKLIRTNGQAGRDSKVTLEALSPKHYGLGNFLFKEEAEPERNDFDRYLLKYSLSLQAEGRVLNLLDWFGRPFKEENEQKTDITTAVEVFSSGNISGNTDQRKTFYGHIAPVYGEFASLKTPIGRMSVSINQVPGKLWFFNLVMADHQYGRPENRESFKITVVDEFGTEHKVIIKPDIEKRTFTLDQY